MYELMRRVKRRARQIVGPAIGACAVGYFAYHAIHGERGLIAWAHYQQRIADAQQSLDRLEAERRLLQHRVRLLHPGSLDRDMLDERARLMLSYGFNDEYVFVRADDLRADRPKDRRTE